MVNENQKKLTIEEFREIRNKINELFGFAADKLDKLGINDIEKAEEANKTFLEFDETKKIQQLTDSLLSSDLSSIPSSEWEDLYILFPSNSRDIDNNFIDFSQTHANLDLKLMTYLCSGGGNFRGCNIENLEGLHNSVLGKSTFDQSIVEANRNLFLSETFSKDFKEKFYSEKLTFEDIINLNDEQIQELEENDRFDYIDNIYIDKERFNDKFKLKNLVEMYSDYGHELTDKFIENHFFVADLTNHNNHSFFEKYMQNMASNRIKNLYKFAEEFGFEKFWDMVDKNYEILGGIENSYYNLYFFEPVFLNNIEDSFDASLKKYLLNNYSQDKYIPEIISSKGYHFEDFKDYTQLFDDKIVLRYGGDKWKDEIVDYNLFDKNLLKDIIEFNEKYKYISHEDINQTLKKIQPNQTILEAFLSTMSSNNMIDYFPSKIKEQYPEFFLTENKPDFLLANEWLDLKRKFYGNYLSIEDIIEHPNYRKALNGKNLEGKKILNYDVVSNLYKLGLSNDDIFSLIDKYGVNLRNFQINLSNVIDSKEIENAIESQIIEAIKEGHTYTELLKNTIGQKHPEFFLTDDKPNFLNEQEWQDLKYKFYNKGLTLNIFKGNPLLLNAFSNTDIACGISSLNMVGKIYGDKSSILESNEIKIELLNIYSKLKDYGLKNSFEEYIQNNQITKDKLPYISEILSKIEYTNSPELKSFGGELANMVLNTDNPIQTFDKIEKIYIRNNLPLFAKSFLAFKILYPDLKPKDRNWDFDDASRISPELKDSSLPKFGYGKTANDYRFNIFYSSLARIAIDSRERSLVEYVDNIDKGNKLYKDLISHKINYDELSKDDKKTLDIFSSHLEVLWENTKKGSKEEIDITGLSQQEKLFKFAELFKPNYDANGVRQGYDLKDRITRSFLYYTGYKSFAELKSHLDNVFVDTEKRNIERAREIQGGKKFKLETGDYLRGIGNYDRFDLSIKSLSGSLDSGNVCKDFLTMFGRGSSSDTTPLDVDITLVNEKENIYRSIDKTPTGFDFGNIFIVIKKDNPKVNVTRDKDGNLTGNKFDPKKIDMFGSRVNDKGWETHWGALVGLALPTDIDYILYKESRVIDGNTPYIDGKVNYSNKYPYEVDDEDKKDLDKIRFINEDLKIIKNEIARKGIYIPVVDFTGELIFTPEEYNNIRGKMQGLSKYGLPEYNLSQNLVTPEILSIREEYKKQQENDTVSKKREAIVDIVKDVLKKHGKSEDGLEVVEQIVGSLEEGKAEFIDTGSTGRGTNVPNDGDFDFMLKLDQTIARNYGEFEQIKNEIRNNYLSVKQKIDNGADIRDKGVMIEGLDEPVDIDVTFAVRTDKIQYSTDECVRDRLNSVKEQYPEQYDLVIANIIEAKKVLKEAHAYKSRKANVPETEKGGLGGVGVENWVLQNGGSFIDAARDFMNVAEGKEFAEFRKEYSVYDFGENHKSSGGSFSHDDFVYNMSPEGYNRMKSALKEYIRKYDDQHTLSQQQIEAEETQKVSQSSINKFHKVNSNTQVEEKIEELQKLKQEVEMAKQQKMQQEIINSQTANGFVEDDSETIGFSK